MERENLTMRMGRFSSVRETDTDHGDSPVLSVGNVDGNDRASNDIACDPCEDAGIVVLLAALEPAELDEIHQEFIKEPLVVRSGIGSVPVG